MGGVSMEWKEVRLGDVCNIITGFPFPGKKYSKEGIRVVRGDNVTIGNLRWDTEKDKRWNEPFDKTEYYSLQANDIVIGMDGSRVGKNKARIKEEDLPLFLAQRVACVRHNELAEQDYLYYNIFSKKFIDYVNSIHTGSAIPHISQKQIEDYMILLPDLKTQRRIASILSSLDRKIELNNKINADLEEMAQAIFQNWFVDFEPFKDGKFVDSELGMIPEGWKVVVFDNILKVTTTKTGKGGIPEYSVTNTGIHPRDEKFTKNLSKSSAKNKLIRKGNLVFGMSREILNWGIMKEEVGGVSSAYNVYIVDEKIVNTTYLECFIAQRMDYFADLIKPASREGQGVDKALLMKKVICIPPSEVMDVFLEKYNSIMHLTEIRNQENSRLSLLRDTLLPRLMSGEIEIPE